MAWGFWRARRRDAPCRSLLAGGAFAIHAYTVLSVQVHENHFYLALPLIAAAGAILPRMRGPYALASAVCLLNLFLIRVSAGTSLFRRATSRSWTRRCWCRSSTSAR